MTMHLQVRNLSYLRQKRRVLQDISFTLTPGTTVLLGHNGAGKSTLFSVLSTALKPTSGTVRLETGQQAFDSQTHAKKYRQHIALVPQNYTPVSGLTVAEHVSYVSWLAGNPSSRANELAEPALAVTGLADLADRKATELSGGETQRLAIAGALATGAHILLLDEPTAGLDPSHKETVNQLIQGIAGERTVLVATHDLYQLDAIYQNVLALSRGQLRYAGSVADFLQPFSGTAEQQALAAFNHFME